MAGLVAANEVTDCHVAAAQRVLPRPKRRLRRHTMTKRKSKTSTAAASAPQTRQGRCTTKPHRRSKPFQTRPQRQWPQRRLWQKPSD